MARIRSKICKLAESAVRPDLKRQMSLNSNYTREHEGGCSEENEATTARNMISEQTEDIHQEDEDSLKNKLTIGYTP